MIEYHSCNLDNKKRMINGENWVDLEVKNEYWAENFKNLDFAGIEISSKEFDGCTFEKCNFSEATFKRCNFVDCDFTN